MPVLSALHKYDIQHAESPFYWNSLCQLVGIWSLYEEKSRIITVVEDSRARMGSYGLHGRGNTPITRLNIVLGPSPLPMIVRLKIYCRRNDTAVCTHAKRYCVPCAWRIRLCKSPHDLFSIFLESAGLIVA